MDRSDFTLRRFNENFAEAVKGQALDFGALIATSFIGAMSVTARCAPPEGDKRYLCLNESLAPAEIPDPGNGYYGASPKLDNDMLIDAISGLRFTDRSGLDAFIAGHGDLFMLHADQAAYLPDFSRLIVLSVAANFGIRIRLPEQNAKKLLAAYAAQTLLAEEDGGVLLLQGCPTAELLAELEAFRFMQDGKRVWTAAQSGLTIREIYKTPKNVTLLRGSVFYSGVLLKPVRFEKLTDRYENDLIDSIVIHFERSTYATVFTLDHNFIRHPLLTESRQTLTKMYRLDDEAKAELIAGVAADPDAPDLIGEVNAYLSRCFNVNQIGVSANVVSSDGFLLMGHRAKGTIDTGALYPGVNGNAEVADKDVSFYNVSVYEDYPTISLDQHRIDFLGEIGREAYAELKLDLPELEWHCYGVIISGDRPKADGGDVYAPPSRRLHFNIMFAQTFPSTFREIREVSREAAEAFENENLLGIDLRCRKSLPAMLWGLLRDAFEWVANQKDAVESLLILILFFTSLLGRGEIENSFADIITIILSAIIIVSTGRSILRLLRQAVQTRKRVRRITLFKHMPREKKDKRLLKLVRGYAYHPAAYASLKLYVDNALFHDFFQPSEGN